MRNDQATPLLSGRDLTKVYNTSEVKAHALRRIDIDIFDSKLVVILAASGSGKSTLLNILGGLDRPTEGDVRFMGKSITKKTRTPQLRFAADTALSRYPEIQESGQRIGEYIMPDTPTRTERVKLRQEARAAAQQTDNSFPSEGIAPLPLAVGMHFGTDAVKHLMETGLDAARFCNGRLAKDVGLLSEFALCRTPADIAELWSRAVSEAAHDYTDQSGRVLAINLNGFEALTTEPANRSWRRRRARALSE